jgi:hypothetical protein
MAKPLPEQIAAFASESQELVRAVKDRVPEIDRLRAELDAARENGQSTT